MGRMRGQDTQQSGIFMYVSPGVPARNLSATVHPGIHGHSMTIKYFQDTDTLYNEFRAAEDTETRDLDENTQLDLDSDGNICAMTIQHSRDRADISPSNRSWPETCRGS